MRRALDARLQGAGISLFFLFGACVFPVSALPGPLLDKARGYDAFYAEHHRPGRGGAVTVDFTDANYTEAARYQGQGDSTVHTGAYLAAESFRYAATGEAEALANAKTAAHALHHHLQITGKKGYLARYAGPFDRGEFRFYPRAKCRGRPGYCHKVKQGDYQGDFWMGNTSRDQYDGWFYGYAVAYELVADPELRAMIRDDVREVIEKFHRTRFNVIDVNHLPTAGGLAFYLPNFRMSWSLAAAVILDEEVYWRRYENEFNRGFPLLKSQMGGARFNKYNDYFAFMFYHRDGYLLGRLDPSPERRQKFLEAFAEQIRPLVAGTDNAFFDWTYLALSGAADPETLAAGREALTRFPEAPRADRCPLPAPDYEVDRCSRLLARVPFLFNVEASAKAPFPIQYRCPEDFLWQRSPYQICRCQEDQPAHVFPGIDYLLAYWMGRYHGYLSEND